MNRGHQECRGETDQLQLPFKLPCFGAFLSSFADDDQEVLCQHKGNAFSLVAELLLFMVEEVAEVDVEQLQNTGNEDGT